MSGSSSVEIMNDKREIAEIIIRQNRLQNWQIDNPTNNGTGMNMVTFFVVLMQLFSEN